MEKINEKASVYDFARLCKANNSCLYCPLGIVNTEVNTQHCAEFISVHTDKANEIILNWCKEHPIETRQERFLKMFPNAQKLPIGGLSVCPKCIEGVSYDCGSYSGKCSICKKEYWLAEVEENE